MGCSRDEANMKQTTSKLRAHVMHVYIQYICFMLASSCKHHIKLSRNLHAKQIEQYKTK